MRLGKIVRADFFTKAHIINTYFFMAGESGKWDASSRRKLLPLEDFVRAIRLFDAGYDWYRRGMDKYTAAFYALTNVRFTTGSGKPVKWCLGCGDELIQRFLNDRRVGRPVLLENGDYKKIEISQELFESKLNYMYGHPYRNDIISLSSQIIEEATSRLKVGRSRFEVVSEVSPGFDI
ncbi:hypothetical protein [Pseudomonas aeruginosa]|uniref:hypothetical protein n=1 Tax=Pseudomonas aeruginosa TaxID=287 RepID=UPI001ED6003F|nr:hypothetical protein [Pseudomonas aeruginosa]MBX6882307.1 hypothetical protein [Pseudomonas aeruginosa]MBX6932743.1 hypothetical protein [Pseudomonas aeruginosa]MCZ9867110.1 hypothetical protein [Pseudomonas aeruginosa]MCZ9906488.1 hypothetical protein [Pseudomonas aeruginosa]WHV60896.1 hypothetical protein M2I93_32720 [Pseudomonas aeruginosa]